MSSIVNDPIYFLGYVVKDSKKLFGSKKPIELLIKISIILAIYYEISLPFCAWHPFVSQVPWLK